VEVAVAVVEVAVAVVEVAVAVVGDEKVKIQKFKI
jgi:hypothetical protein